MCTRTLEHMHTHSRADETKKRGKEGEKKQDLGCLWVCFTPTLFCLALPPLHGRKQGHWSRVWCDTLLRPLFCTTPANMRAHLSRALKPSLILWRPKHFNFFQQTSSQLALDCQWGSPNSKIYHLETHKSPLRQIFPFKASQKRKKKKRKKKGKRALKLRVEMSNSMSSPPPPFFLFFFSLPLGLTRKKTDINILR